MSDIRVADIAHHTDLLLRTCASLTDAQVPSLCAGWSRGHVLTHLARNADGLARAVDGALDGGPQTMYDSDEARDADIEAGADRPLPDLVTDVRDSATRISSALDRIEGHGGARFDRTPGGVSVPVERVPDMRRREVVYHHVDLDAGFGFEDVEPDLLGVFIDEEVRRLRARDDAPAVTLTSEDAGTWTAGGGGPVIRGTSAGLLLWLARQIDTGITADTVPRLEPEP